MYTKTAKETYTKLILLIIMAYALLIISSNKSNPDLSNIYSYETGNFENYYRLEPKLRKLADSDSFTLKIIQNFDNCSSCNMQKDTKYANSVYNDVIIASGFTLCYHACLFVRTLRGTGSKAQVVILLDDESFNKLDPVSKEELAKCGAQLVNCGTFEFINKRSRFTLKFVLTHLFIKKNRKLMNRVILVDLFDTVFQSDPFNVQIGAKDELNVIDEGKRFNESEFNRRVLRGWNYFLSSDDMPKYYKCSGYIGGTVDVMYLYTELCYELMYSLKDRDDQGLLNYIAFSGIAEQAGLKIAPFRDDELVRHSWHYHTPDTFGNASSLRNPNVRAAIVHHIYTNPNYIMSAENACPKKEGQIYYSTLSKNALKFENPSFFKKIIKKLSAWKK